MTEHKSCVFRFADIEVREREFCIVKNGQVLAIEPKAFRVLLCLIRNPRQLVSKDELLDAVWNDCSVSENSLTQCVARLRRALGDDTHEPRYIATVPTLGYRFLLEVQVAEDGHLPLGIPVQNGNATESGATETERPTGERLPRPRVFSSNQLIEEVPPTKVKRRPLYLGLAILGVVVATAATLALWRAAFRTPSPPKVLRFTRLTNDGQGKFGPMVSDGSRIYFNELLPGPRNLVVQVSVKGGEATSLSVPLALPVVLDLSRDGTELLVADSVLANEVGIQVQVTNSMLANVGLEPHALWVQPVAGGSPHRIGTILVADARFVIE
jgi:DNA-binding winged helix-turn-helix (wHTH) protein